MTTDNTVIKLICTQLKRKVTIKSSRFNLKNNTHRATPRQIYLQGVKTEPSSGLFDRQRPAVLRADPDDPDLVCVISSELLDLRRFAPAGGSMRRPGPDPQRQRGRNLVAELHPTATAVDAPHRERRQRIRRRRRGSGGHLEVGRRTVGRLERGR